MSKFTVRVPQGQKFNFRRQKRKALGFDEEKGAPIYGFEDSDVITAGSSDANGTEIEFPEGGRIVVESP